MKVHKHKLLQKREQTLQSLITNLCMAPWNWNISGWDVSNPNHVKPCNCPQCWLCSAFSKVWDDWSKLSSWTAWFQGTFI